MNRKTKRALKKKMGPDAADRLANQVALFSKLPEACSSCTKEFDNKDVEMIKTWKVVVRQDKVRLFCPGCIDKAKEAIDGSI
ncbi:MAG: hypothetical protein CMF52_03145 [Legionellales bacterium]|nr:hypothetical protein [Legionellales bacterium]|tara:strand:- start:62 stop:307 length:246 start_codon:yes stop_codon:yes gene_type:complete